MIEKISILISFVAIVVGIIGNTWDKKKSGIKRITITGWLIIITGMTTCSIAFYKDFEKKQQLNWQEQQKHKVMKIAYSELDETFNNLLGTFGLVYENSCFDENYTHNDSCNIEKFYKDDEYRFKQLTSRYFINFLDSIDLNSSPRYSDVYPEATWGELFFENAVRNKAKLNEIWLKYNLYFTTETILKLNAILNDDFFKMRLIYLDTLIKANDHKSKYYASWAFVKGPDNGEQYFGYIKKIREIKDEIRKCQPLTRAHK